MLCGRDALENILPHTIYYVLYLGALGQNLVFPFNTCLPYFRDLVKFSDLNDLVPLQKVNLSKLLFEDIFSKENLNPCVKIQNVILGVSGWN